MSDCCHLGVRDATNEVNKHLLTLRCTGRNVYFRCLGLEQFALAAWDLELVLCESKHFKPALGLEGLHTFEFENLFNEPDRDRGEAVVNKTNVRRAHEVNLLIHEVKSCLDFIPVPVEVSSSLFVFQLQQTCVLDFH